APSPRRAREYIGALASDSPAETPQRGTSPPAQHPKGWRVDPAPDGRGAPPPQKQPMVPRGPGVFIFLAALLPIHLLISIPPATTLLTSIPRTAPPSRPRVPYQPFFVNQVNANNVQETISTGESIEGTLKNAATYDPPGDAKPVKVDKNFKTEVPSFIDPAS